MLKETQKNWAINQLETKGFISRNEALRNYITRLGARVCDLNSEGYNLIGEYKEINGGKDFVYTHAGGVEYKKPQTAMQKEMSDIYD